MHPNKIITEDLDTICASGIDWTRFDGKTVLITGASGFLPAYIVETLLHARHKGLVADVHVKALVRNRDNALARFAHHRDNRSLELVVQDVSEPVDVDRKTDYIIHAASQASPKYYGTDPAGTIKANTLGTYNMLELARRHDSRMLYFSSSEVYGKTPDGVTGITETDYGYLNPATVRACYGEGKRAGETMCVSWAAQYGMSVVAVRPFHTYGPGMSLDDGRVFADFVRDIVHDKDIVMNSDGSAVRAFCYLTDATRAFFRLLLDGVSGQSYNMGNPHAASSIIELARTLTALYPEKKLTVTAQRVASDGYLRSTVPATLPDITKIAKLGWKPVVSIPEGFRRTIDCYLL